MVLELDGVAQNPPPVHSFKNEYFKYHGKWQTGLVKSGPGALLMDDGKTYVTCNFTNGEIDGEGVRVRCVPLAEGDPQLALEQQEDGFSFLPAVSEVYQGQFRRGEAHGYGYQERKLLVQLRPAYSAYQEEYNTVFGANGVGSKTQKIPPFQGSSAALMVASNDGGAAGDRGQSQSHSAAGAVATSSSNNLPASSTSKAAGGFPSSRPDSRSSAASSGAVRGMTLDTYMSQTGTIGAAGAGAGPPAGGFSGMPSRSGTPGTAASGAAGTTGTGTIAESGAPFSSPTTKTKTSGSRSRAPTIEEGTRRGGGATSTSPSRSPGAGAGKPLSIAHFDESMIPLGAQNYALKKKLSFSKYTGNWRDNKYHGDGKLLTENVQYRGQFADHKFHGDGRLKTKQGERYAGQFANNAYEGEGVQRTGDETVSGFGALSYSGQFQNGQRNGTGAGRCLASGLSYQGTWSDGFPIAQASRLDVRKAMDAAEDPVAEGDAVEAPPPSWLVPRESDDPEAAVEYLPVEMKRDTLPISWLITSVDKENVAVRKEGGRQIRVYLCPKELTAEEQEAGVLPNAPGRRCHETTGVIEGGDCLLTWDALPEAAGTYVVYIVVPAEANTHGKIVPTCFRHCGLLSFDLVVID
eukprot:CAMPEP_0178998098 /NCGR_PEP_ID=MMETSP0795-20121207/9338_1 /TAXON_ID=88552 /ORGANISM="Amoebophrya sp., Strain Ameob2" /LENGTH=633 /DNA_ID=CAMNT_0020690767 /DNA_START=94 /DNA_END=1995 /DNA_ORIENTATION=-